MVVVRQIKRVKQVQELVEAEYRSEHVQRVPVTEARAKLWLAQRNVLARILDGVQGHLPGGDDLPSELVEKIDHLVVELQEVLTAAEKIDKENESVGLSGYKGLQGIIGDAYILEGYHPLTDDVDPRPDFGASSDKARHREFKPDDDS